MVRTRFIALAVMILAAAGLRLLPHPPNFTPIAAMALFGGATFGDVRVAFLVPLAAMALSDAVLGFHALAPLVYGAFALIVLIGISIRRRRTLPWITLGALGGSVIFFLVTNFNFAIWGPHVLYPKTWAGMLAAYAAAVPFFRNTLLGDLTYTALLFGGFALLERSVPAMRESSENPAAIRVTP